MTLLVLKVIHVLCVALFTGALASMLQIKTVGAPEVGGARALLVCIQLDRIIIAPSALAITVSGLALWWVHAQVGDTPLWIWILLVGWASCSGIGLLFLGPGLKRLACNTDRSSLQYRRLSYRWNFATSVVLLALAALVAVAVFRPQ